MKCSRKQPSGREIHHILETSTCGPVKMHCAVSFSKKHYSLCSNGSAQKDRKASQHDQKLCCIGCKTSTITYNQTKLYVLTSPSNQSPNYNYMSKLKTGN